MLRMSALLLKSGIRHVAHCIIEPVSNDREPFNNVAEKERKH
jgi:hypothetical protein